MTGTRPEHGQSTSGIMQQNKQITLICWQLIWPEHDRNISNEWSKTKIVSPIPNKSWLEHGRNMTPSTAKKTLQKHPHADNEKNNKAWPPHHRNTSSPDTNTITRTRLQQMWCQALQEQHARSMTGTWQERDRNMTGVPQEQCNKISKSLKLVTINMTGTWPEQFKQNVARPTCHAF